MTSTAPRRDHLVGDTTFEGTPSVPDDLSSLPGLTVSADPGRLACRLRLTGTLDGDTVPLFAACLQSWVDRGVRHMVLDLSGVRHVDDAGARALTAAVHVLGRAGGSLSLLAPRRLASGPLASCGLDLVEHTTDSRDDTVIGISHGE